MKIPEERTAPPVWMPAVLLLALHLFLLMALPLKGVQGYGDWPYFFQLTALKARGLFPFIGYWSEYPPVTPLLSTLFYTLGNGSAHVYVYLWALTLSLADAAILLAVDHIARRLLPARQNWLPAWLYLGSGLPLVMAWWNFDLLAIAFWMWGLALLLEKRDTGAAVLLALGALTKFFPLLTLPLLWRIRKPAAAFKITVLTVGLFGLAWLPFAIQSPAFTTASLRAQTSKGSWETVWALVDGNLTTGVFGAVENHLDPALAARPVGQPARIPSWATLLVFGAFGLWALLRAEIHTPRQALAMLALTWGIFALWSPGWSPQWALYVLPFILLLFTPSRAVLFALVFGAVNLLEWPLLLSRGWYQALWITIPLRTLLIFILVWEFWNAVSDGGSARI